MNNNYVVIAFCILWLPVFCHAKTDKRPSDIQGRYVFTDSTFIASASLTLEKTGNYSYTIGTDLAAQHSYGRWCLKGDTLILTAQIKQKDIPVSVTEAYTDSVKNGIAISLVENLDKEVMDAIFMFNGDTTSLCIPLLESGCEREVGSIDSFQIRFSNETSTPWIKLKNKRTNVIRVTALVHDVLALFLFFDNEKLLYNDGCILFGDMVLRKVVDKPFEKY